MRQKGWWAALAMGLAASAAAGETVEEVLARHVEARGGAAKLAAVSSLRLSGRMMLGQGREAPFLYEWKRPNQFRFELTMQGVTEVQAFDGESGWTTDPPGQPDPQPMAPMQLAMMNDAIDFEGRLVNPKQKGIGVELVGKTEVEGTPAWEIQVTRADGGVEHSYLDAEYFLEILQLERYETPGGPMEMEVTWGDYKEMGGALFPGSWSRKPRGGQGGPTLLFEQVEVNPELPDSRFAMP